MISRFMIVVLALIFVVAYMAEAQVITDGLLMYWTFDQADVDGETAKDVIGGNDGTIFGDPEVVEGKFNQALEFAGNNDYLEVALKNMSLADSEKKGELLSNLVLGGVPAVTVGRDPGFSGWFIGIIDEFRIYERPLSAEEVRLNMEAKKLAVEASSHKLAETWGNIKVSR